MSPTTSVSHSTIDPSLTPLTPSFPPRSSTSTTPPTEPPTTAALIAHLSLQPHIEGGYFVETDRDTFRIPNPFDPTTESTRSASTTIHYLLTPASPLGHSHRNRGRTVHTLHKGRGRYVIVHADEVAAEGGGYPARTESGKDPAEPAGEGHSDDSESKAREEEKMWLRKSRIETFVVGQDILKGERVQWIVEGGKYKCSYLLPDEEGGEESKEGLLISETVVPGFEYEDHDFCREERLRALVGEEQYGEMQWMVRRS